MTSRWIGVLLITGLASGGLTVGARSLTGSDLTSPGQSVPGSTARNPDAPGSSTGAEATLASLDAAIQQAAVSGDATLLEQHLADDFAFTHFGGGRDDKAHWVGLARRTPRPYARRAVSEQQVEAHGDVALVLGRLDVETTPRPPQTSPVQAGPVQAGAVQAGAVQTGAVQTGAVQAGAGQAGAGPACYALRYVHVYARREGRWTFLSHHTTSMIEESHPCR
jgi:ketosteroid isomerase-like protein